MTVICHGGSQHDWNPRRENKKFLEQVFLNKAIASAQFQIFSKNQRFSG